MNAICEELAYRQQGGASLVNHRHRKPDSYEIIHVLSGTGSAFIRDRNYPVRSGTLLFIDAAALHCVTPDDVTEYTRSKLILDRTYLKNVFSAIGAPEALDAYFGAQGGSCFDLDEQQSRRADMLFAGIAESGDGSSERLKVVNALLNLFELCEQTAEPAAPQEDDKLAPVFRYLRLHYAEALSVERIAADTHMSKYHLCHLFRRKTGLTLMEYLYEQRLAAARQQLLMTDLPVSAIAQNCGFGSSSHFSSLFRRRESLSPREYRQKHGKK